MTKELYCVAKGLCYDAKGLYCRTLISVAKFPASLPFRCLVQAIPFPILPAFGEEEFFMVRPAPRL